jgi:gp32 DNA binding protein like
MAIDINKMKQKLNALHTKGGGSTTKFWKTPDGESVIRVVPTSDNDPFKEFHFHYNVGGENGFLCPKKNFGDECKVCEFVSTLYKGTEEDKANARKLVSKQRFVSPILVRGEEDKGVQLFSYSKKVYETLLQLVINPDYGDISDAEEGIDLVLAYGKAPGAMFPTTTITPRRRSSPIVADKKQRDELLSVHVDFANLFERKTPDQVAQALDRFLSGDDEAAEGGDVAEKEVKYAGSASKSAVDEAFDDLLK